MSPHHVGEPGPHTQTHTHTSLRDTERFPQLLKMSFQFSLRTSAQRLSIVADFCRPALGPQLPTAVFTLAEQSLCRPTQPEQHGSDHTAEREGQTCGGWGKDPVASLNIPVAGGWVGGVGGRPRRISSPTCKWLPRSALQGLRMATWNRPQTQKAELYRWSAWCICWSQPQDHLQEASCTGPCAPPRPPTPNLERPIQEGGSATGHPFPQALAQALSLPKCPAAPQHPTEDSARAKIPRGLTLAAGRPS